MIKITVLHNELEHFINSQSGFSILIEVNNTRILHDTSHSDDFLINAKKAGIDLRKLDFLVLSHGHWDHTNGIKFLTGTHPLIIAHPNCFEKKNREMRYIGAPLTLAEVKTQFKVELCKHPREIIRNVFFLGEIPRIKDFEAKKAVGKRNKNEDDFVLDDSAVIIKLDRGLIVIAGCSHSGICNIIEYAKAVAEENKIAAVIGGFHLFDKEQTNRTIDYFKKHVDGIIYPLHCLDAYAFVEFEKIGAKRLRTLEAIEL